MKALRVAGTAAADDGDADSDADSGATLGGPRCAAAATSTRDRNSRVRSTEGMVTVEGAAPGRAQRSDARGGTLSADLVRTCGAEIAAPPTREAQ